MGNENLAGLWAIFTAGVAAVKESRRCCLFLATRLLGIKGKDSSA